MSISLPKVNKKEDSKNLFYVGVCEIQLGIEMKSKLGIACVCNETTKELLRGIRKHFHRFTHNLTNSDINRVQVGLSHAFSRTKFNVRKTDNMIIHVSALLDTLDKDINLFFMKLKEWYGWHFPELTNIVKSNLQYVRILLIIKDKSKVSREDAFPIAEILEDHHKSKMIIEAARSSMGQELCPIDFVNIEAFANKVIELANFREKLHNYMDEKMHEVAPNLSVLLGSHLGAKLISQTGSLVNLAKCSASTVQILGAEKALFRAIKTRRNTPKYGIIYNSSFIGKIRQRNKGRISRYLANKCVIAARVDAFMVGFSSNAFGLKLREQVEGRIRFYDEGITETKNITAMQEVLQSMETKI